MRSPSMISFFALALGACCDLQTVRSGSHDVTSEDLEAAADCPPDAGLDLGLQSLLAVRAAARIRILDDARTEQLIHTVAQRGDPGAIAGLEALLWDPSPDVRIDAIDALDRAGAVGSLPSLRRLALYDPDPSAREMAYYAISSLTEQRVRYLDARSVTKR